ncbi:GNAT family N-acetyltransferase [Oharaeibacter diazotrophicus]|uniref:Acetyltransferase (GNAT) family protein n=1 Tax=Oharaeibacter diazotrophicus TaxID=1920512 RepID=A0A4R6RJR2_9HYPH|nr:GNAT family N-acetyltransferase [Oharaeibacter diazotrophicus]TDP86809.1 acetyltransferase (GNAT) family protein [Oharaeibacter diazotrophicus]BBE71248.1 putative acetyltransferase [Pleomorphomonas sp. SM30]GLS78002.1 N-acetyltransferase [Oharaeibacter diazotrophicus]
MTDGPTIRVIRGDAAAELRPAIVAPLIAFNRETFGPSDRELFAAVLEDPATGETVGGLYGEASYGWTYVQLLVVPAAQRGRDLGTRLIAEAEAFARARGSRGVFLDTFEFQARGFYEKLGYVVFGELEGGEGAVRRFFLKKVF